MWASRPSSMVLSICDLASPSCLIDSMTILAANQNSCDADQALGRLYKLLFWGVIAFIVGLVYIVLGRALGQEMVSVVGVLIMLLVMLLAALGVLAPLRPKKKRPARAGAPAALMPAGPAPYLPPESLGTPVPTVTERTTKLFEPREAAAAPPNSSGGLRA